jgi:hypothetical protein
MTDSPQALRHYQTAIRALLDGSYSGLSDRERDELLRVLRAEKHRLLRARCAPDPVRGRRRAPSPHPTD